MSQPSTPFKDGKTHDINPVQADGTVFCYCNIPAVKYTSRTSANPDRNFYCCRKYKEDPHNCKFFLWADSPVITSHPAHQPEQSSSQSSEPTSSQPSQTFQPPSQSSPLKRPASPLPSQPMPPSTPTRARVNLNVPRTPSTPQGRVNRMKDIEVALGLSPAKPEPANLPTTPVPASNRAPASRTPDQSSQTAPAPAAPAPKLPQGLEDDEFAAEYDSIPNPDSEPERERVAAGMQTDADLMSEASQSQSPSPLRSHAQGRSYTNDDGDIDMDSESRTQTYGRPPSSPTSSRNPSPAKRARVEAVKYPRLSPLNKPEHRLPGDWDVNPFADPAATPSTYAHHVTSTSRQLLTPPASSNDLPQYRAPHDLQVPESPTPPRRTDKGKGKARAREEDEKMEARAEEGMSVDVVPGGYGYPNDDREETGSVREVDLLVQSSCPSTPVRSVSRLSNFDLPMDTSASFSTSPNTSLSPSRLPGDSSTAQINAHTVKTLIDGLPEYLKKLQDIPNYIEKLERKKRAAEKSAEAKARKIVELKGTEEGMRETIDMLMKRNEELEKKVEAMSRRR